MEITDDLIRLAGAIWIGVSLAKFTGWLPNALVRTFYTIQMMRAQSRAGRKG